MKKNLSFIPLIFLLLACSTQPQKEDFPNKDVCFLLFNLKTGTFEKIINQARCEERFPAASTFKIPLAIMAFDAKILKGPDSILKWDGKKKFLPAWEKDQTALSWMKESVVWFSQEITPKLGKERIEEYLQSFEFGNADMSGGIKYAWLTKSQFDNSRNENSLKISGFEQTHFLKNLWRGELKASTEAQLKTISLLAVEISPEGNRLLGKTGSGFIGADHELRIGWWAGYLETKQDSYVVVINFSDKQKLAEKSFGGAEARDIAKQILTERKLW